MNLPLILKYRPLAVGDVVGQDAAGRALASAIVKRSSQAFLLTGPSGVGKTTLARIGAAGAGAKPGDIMEIDAATHSGIDDMRAIAESMNYRPLMGKAKAIIIDEAHALSKPAVTSLLKAFEEPPPWGFWFMCTTEPTKVPAAIKTRCLHVNLKAIDPDLMTPVLAKVARAEKLAIGKNQAKVIEICVLEAQGSMRQAIVNLVACAEAGSVEEAREMLASALESPQAVELARALLNGTNWRTCQKMLSGMKDQNAESVRQVVRAYMTSCALSIPNGDKLKNALAVLEAFSEPCHSQDGISPIVIRCARVLL